MLRENVSYLCVKWIGGERSQEYTALGVKTRKFEQRAIQLVLRFFANGLD